MAERDIEIIGTDNSNYLPSNFGENIEYFRNEETVEVEDIVIEACDNPGFIESIQRQNMDGNRQIGNPSYCDMKERIPSEEGNGRRASVDSARYEDISINDNRSDVEAPIKKPRAKRVEYVFNTIGFVVGLGNVWRFSSLCFKYGGGVFLPIYTLFYLCIGLPLFFLEIYIGQFTSRGCIECWGNCLILRAVGVGAVSISLAVVFTYSMNLIWSCKYLVLSMFNPVPWSNQSVQAPCNPNCSYSAHSYFRGDGFHLNQSPSIGDLGLPQWEMILASIFIWSLLFFSLFKGFNLSGKIIYVTILYPYLAGLILLFHGLSLDGATKGIADFMSTKDISLNIGNNDLWSDAAAQILFSLSLAQGGLTCLSSLNDFHGNVLMNAVIVTFTDYCSSLLFGLVVFCYVGYVKYGLKIPIQYFTNGRWDGVTLLFIIVPQALSESSLANLWAIVFFLALISLAFDVVLTLIRTVGFAIFEGIPKKVPFKGLYINISICTFGFISTIALCTPGGIYLLELINHYGSRWTLILVGFLEIVFIMALYGGDEIRIDIGLMLEKEIRTRKIWKYVQYYFLACWYCVTPLLLIYLLITDWIHLTNIQDTFVVFDKPFPKWASALGWMIALCTPISIIVTLVVYLIQAKGTFIQRLKYMRNSNKEGPLWQTATLSVMDRLKEIKTKKLNRQENN